MAGLVLAAGCAMVAGDNGTPGVTYGEISLAASLDGGLDQAARATDTALQQLTFAGVSEHRDSLNDTIVARTAANKLVEIQLTSVSETLTKVTIQVGAFGDEALSRSILAKIKEGL